MTINCPNNLPKKKNKWYVFLAGPIQGAPDWQHNMPEIDGVTWLSPRRTSYNNFNYDEQVKWETECLRIADVVMFWVPEPAEVVEGRDYAQTTRTEYGEMLARGKKVIIGINRKFPGRRYFVSKAEQYGLNGVHDTLENTIKELKEYIKECNKKSNVFFTSDTHFSQERTLKLSKRPFRDLDDMDWTIIERWNRVVHPNDTVYHLGDFGELWPMQYLNGNIHLIEGNYERDPNKNGNKPKAERHAEYRKAGFVGGITEDYTIFTDKASNNETEFILCHEPLTGMAVYEKKQHAGNDNCMVLYGHIHGRVKVKHFGVDVGTDSWNYTPMSMEDIEFFRNALDKGYYDNEVWCNTMPDNY